MRLSPGSSRSHITGIRSKGDTPWVDSQRINKYAKIYTKELSFDDVKMIEDASEDEEGCLTLDELRRKLVSRCNEQFAQSIDLPKNYLQCEYGILGRNRGI